MWKRHEINFAIQQKILHISEKDDLYKIVHSYYHGKYQIIYQKAPIQETELDINENFFERMYCEMTTGELTTITM